MKNLVKTLLVLLLFSNQINAQNSKVVEWINKNAIEIEDANPDSDLVIFNKNAPQKFSKAKIFGFGEATHHTKEFFDLKTKFFKYLVEKQNVKVFIMEESFPSEININKWISGGEGNIKTIANNFSIAPWYCKEIVDLLKWMRTYNSTKSKEEHIRFYGMDIQYVKGIDTIITNHIKKHKIKIEDELLQTLKDCVNKQVSYGKKTNWADLQIPKLEKIKNILINSNVNSKKEDLIRPLEYLIKYTYYVQNHYSQDRDLKMFENVQWIVNNLSKNKKAFIWAHNEHINNSGFNNYSKRSIYNLGRLLKENYKDDYYSVGFDFGSGNLRGLIMEKGKKPSWKTNTIEKPNKKTYAQTFFKANKDIYFIDIEDALNSNVAKFFSKKKRQLVLGGPGYNPKKNHLYTKKLSEMYDGLIFIKKISLPNYNLK